MERNLPKQLAALVRSFQKIVDHQLYQLYGPEDLTCHAIDTIIGTAYQQENALQPRNTIFLPYPPSDANPTTSLNYEIVPYEGLTRHSYDIITFDYSTGQETHTPYNLYLDHNGGYTFRAHLVPGDYQIIKQVLYEDQNLFQSLHQYGLGLKGVDNKALFQLPRLRSITAEDTINLEFIAQTITTQEPDYGEF